MFAAPCYKSERVPLGGSGIKEARREGNRTGPPKLWRYGAYRTPPASIVRCHTVLSCQLSGL